jgi:hypothetical protein
VGGARTGSDSVESGLSSAWSSAGPVARLSDATCFRFLVAGCEEVESSSATGKEVSLIFGVA